MFSCLHTLFVVASATPCLIAASLATSAERVPLFPGDTFEGWTTLEGEPVTSDWKIADGVIHLRPADSRSAHIVTERKFGDFRLAFEWKIANRGNSGIKYRVKRYPRNKWRGCEYQILDDLGRGTNPTSNTSTGALYDLYAPNDHKPLRPAGEFNQTLIVVVNNKIEHWLNGRLIVDATAGSADWRRRVANSKFADLHDFGENQCGRIMLTDHGSEVWYRHFEFELLSSTKRSAPEDSDQLP